MRAALAAYRATGARFQSTSHLILLAQALTACGRHDEGLSYPSGSDRLAG